MTSSRRGTLSSIVPGRIRSRPSEANTSTTVLIMTIVCNKPFGLSRPRGQPGAPVRHPFQAQMPTERGVAVLAAEQPAVTKDRDHVIDEEFQPGREHVGHQ